MGDESKAFYRDDKAIVVTNCGADAVVVVGGGNSAGQPGLFSAESARKVFLLIRGRDVGNNMSDYLVQRIVGTKNIEFLPNTEISKMFGDGHLEAVELKNNQSGEPRPKTRVIK